MYGHYIRFILSVKVFSIAMDSLSNSWFTIDAEASPHWRGMPLWITDARIHTDKSITKHIDKEMAMVGDVIDIPIYKPISKMHVASLQSTICMQ